MFKNLSLSKKITFAFIGINLFMAATGVATYYGFQYVTEHFTEISNKNLPKAIVLGDLRANAMATVRNTTLLAIPEISSELRTEYKDKLLKRIELFEKAEEEFQKIGITASEKKSFDEIVESWTPIKTHSLEILKLAQENAHANESRVISILTRNIEAEMDELTKHIRELDDTVSHEAEALVKEAITAEHAVDLFNIFAVIFGVVSIQLFGFFFIRSLSGSIISVVNDVSESSNVVASASQQIAAAATELSSITGSQASALQETSSAGEEINAMVSRNSEGAEQSKTISTKNMNRAEDGQKSVQEMTRAMDEIASSNEQIRIQMQQNNNEMSEIIKAINEINEKTKVINEIVFQTKLLSFNASVEAARAGEAGKGFAVVAEEVGNLAQMSGKSSQEITTLLEKSTKRVKEIITNSRASVETLLKQASDKIDTGKSIADQCREVLLDVVTGSTEVLQACEDVYTASQEQSKGVNEITQALSSLNQSNQEISSAAEQSASASEELNAQAGKLQVSVKTLQAIVHGKNSATNSFVQDGHDKSESQSIESAQPSRSVAA